MNTDELTLKCSGRRIWPDSRILDMADAIRITRRVTERSNKKKESQKRRGRERKRDNIVCEEELIGQRGVGGERENV